MRERECPRIVVPVVTVCCVQSLPRARKCTFGVGAQHREGGASEEADNTHARAPRNTDGSVFKRLGNTKTKFGSECSCKGNAAHPGGCKEARRRKWVREDF